MNCLTAIFISRRSQLIVTLIGLSLSSPTFGQPKIKPHDVGSERAELVRQTTANSKALFAAKRNSEAEQALFALNRSKAGTANWHVESAGALVRLASEFADGGDADRALELAQRALQFLAQAESLAKPQEKGVTASAKDLAGFIYERFIGDSDSAEESYRAATLLAPDLTPAHERFARLKKVKENAAEKGRTPGQ